MTRALVVFESMYGNTQHIAEAIAEGLASQLPVEVAEVSAAPLVLPPDIGLVVLGGPTHRFGLSRPASRERAAAKHEPLSVGLGLRDWIEQVEWEPGRLVAATFDTKRGAPRFFWGSAARAARKAVRARSVLVLGAKDFYVTFGADEDALEPGELERARAWGRELATELLTESGALEPASAVP